MTKLEWCRANAPKAIQNLSDEELLVEMDSSYQKFGKEEVDEEVECESVEYNPINKQMDFMVLMLTREFGDQLAFKGGYMLTKLIPKYARQTTDIDFSIASSDLYRQLVSSMDRLGCIFVSKGAAASYKVKPEVHERMSGGMDLYDVNGRKILGIDIGWHDLTFGLTTTNIGVTNVTSFSIERMLSDKITAILSRKRFRRPKDLYDVYCISNCFDFDFNLINEFILKRTDGVGADWGNYPFSQTVLREYEKAYNSLKLQSIVRDTSLDRPEFSAVMYRFDSIYYGCKGGNERWDHLSGMSKSVN